jgi:hypothetical protein
MNVLPLHDQSAGAIVDVATNLAWSELAQMAHYMSVGAMRFLCSSKASFVSGQVLTNYGGLTLH